MAPQVSRSFWLEGYTIDGRLSDAYLDMFTALLDDYGVPHVRIGGTVLLRLWDRIDDPGDWVLNADQKTIRYLANPERNPLWKHMPADVRARLVALKAGEPGGFCEFHRILVLKDWGQ